MAIGDVRAVDENGVEDLYYVDIGMYGTEGYGAVYILDAEVPAIVETGMGRNHEMILDALDELGIRRAEVEVIAPTHVHLDHAGGAGILAQECPNAEVLTHEIGVPHLIDPDRLVEGTKRAVGEQWQYYDEPIPVPEDRITSLNEGDEIDLGDHVLDVYHAPGHAPHQVVFHDRQNDAVFAGDAAGIWIPEANRVRQTTPPPNFDLELAENDAERLEDIDPETLLFTHFGPNYDPQAVLEEYEDVLSAWVAEVEAARDELPDDEAVVEQFVDTTEMAEYWGEEKAEAEERLNTTGVLVYLDHRE